MSKHTPGPWWSDDGGLVREEATDATIARVYADDGHIDPRRRREMPRAANGRLIAAAPDLLEALHIQHACGAPQKAILYDEEGVEGWRWVHPDGREWTAVGAWDDAPPMHPAARAAIAKATGAST